jgi:hypothetical protein
MGGVLVLFVWRHGGKGSGMSTKIGRKELCEEENSEEENEFSTLVSSLMSSPYNL